MSTGLRRIFIILHDRHVPELAIRRHVAAVIPTGDASENMKSESGGSSGWDAERQVLFAANLQNHYTIPYQPLYQNQPESV